MDITQVVVIPADVTAMIEGKPPEEVKPIEKKPVVSFAPLTPLPSLDAETKALIEPSVRHELTISGLTPEIEEALNRIQKVLEENNKNIGALLALGQFLMDTKAFDEAMHFYNTALIYTGELKEEGKPYLKELAECYAHIGTLYQLKGDVEQSEVLLAKALEISPARGDVRSNLALAYQKRGEDIRAIFNYGVAHGSRPDQDDVAFNLGSMLLQYGVFEDGWPLFNRRQHKLRTALRDREFEMPLLTKLEDAQDKHVFVWEDQGVGDTILFSQLIPKLREYASITLEADRRFHSIFQRTFPHQENRTFDVSSADAWFRCGYKAKADFHLPLSNLASLFIKSFDDFPRLSGYLKPCPQMVTAYKEKYKGKRVIGLSWRSTPDTKMDKYKAVPLAQLEPILRIPDVYFINLQYDNATEEIEAAEKEFGVTIEHDRFDYNMADMENTLAKIAACDTVIASSGTTAHIAGALGVKTYVIVPKGYGRLWFWFDKEFSPWYPSVRIFGQQEIGKWDDPIWKTHFELV